jgi:hypothetical protein
LYPHEYFEGLCAGLAANGQASQSELERLNEHLPTCPGCRELLGDFARINAHVVAEIADKHSPVRVPPGMKARFLARAYSEGLFLNKDQGNRRTWFNAPALARWSAVVVSVALIAVSLKFAAVRRSVAPHAPPGPSVQLRATSAGGNNAGNIDLVRQLESEKTARVALEKQLGEVQTLLESERQEKAGLNSRLAQLESADAELRKTQAERDAEVSQFRDDITKTRSERDAARVASFLSESELKELREKVARQGNELAERHQLNDAATQARDLIVARNLHIVDVHDTDENGKGQRAFGRIFYTEGTSLVFYAYDLADRKQVSAKISFYVWGEKLGDNRPVKNLGVFRSDDVNDGRWVLSFDDARVLARINSVFVTVESNKRAVTQPSGKKILYAFLGDKANHP